MQVCRLLTEYILLLALLITVAAAAVIQINISVLLADLLHPRKDKDG